MARQVKRKKSNDSEKLPFTRQNYILFGIGLVVLLVGFKSMSIGPWNSFWSLTLSPILLILAFCVIFPVAILYKKKERQ
jgi:ATP/ADP translocase